MTINSRTKGATFERAIAKELELLTGIKFQRNLEQSRTVDHCDLLADDADWPFSLELKRYASGTGCKPEWRAQAERAATKSGKIPAVVYQFDRRAIRVAVPFIALGHDRDAWAEINLDDLAYFAREIMAGKAA